MEIKIIYRGLKNNEIKIITELIVNLHSQGYIAQFLYDISKSKLILKRKFENIREFEDAIKDYNELRYHLLSKTNFFYDASLIIGTIREICLAYDGIKFSQYKSESQALRKKLGVI